MTKHPAAREGITFIDMMMTVAVISIVAVSMVPSLTPDAHLRLQSASVVLSADLEYAQSASVSFPDDPTVLRIREDGLGYWLARKSAPDTPIDLPNSAGEAYEIEFGAGRGEQFDGVFFQLGEDDATTVEFDAFGRLATEEDTALEIRNLSGGIAVRIAGATGSVFAEGAD